jgi:CDP-diacylglycerol---serine O-phosphatidyltransferase
MRKFGKFRNSLKPKLVSGVHPIPTLVTLGNLVCGFGAIVLAMRANNPPSEFYDFQAKDCLYWSGILIFIAMIFDVMDGKVARWTKSTSKFGMEMDSLCDVVSFGAAPAVLVKAMIDQQLRTNVPFPLLDRYVFPLLVVYVCCAAIRLARYNVESETVHRDFFFGMPSPGAAGCVASLAILITPKRYHFQFGELQGPVTYVDQLRESLHWPLLIALPFVMLGLGVLMVSRVHYPHMGDRLLRGKKSFRHMIGLGLALVLVVMNHEVMLAIAFNGYMIFGLVNELRYHIFPDQRPAEWVSTGEPEPPAQPSGPSMITPTVTPPAEPPAI